MIAVDQLVMLELDELQGADAERVEDHVLACGHCAAVLERLLQLGEGVRAVVREGRGMFVATPAILEKLQGAGLISRSHFVEAGKVVPCAVGAGDVYSLTTLATELLGVTQLDVVRTNHQGTGRMRDVPFDAETGRVLLVTRSELLRSWPSGRIRFEVVAVEPGGERKISEHALEHVAAEG